MIRFLGALPAAQPQRSADFVHLVQLSHIQPKSPLRGSSGRAFWWSPSFLAKLWLCIDDPQGTGSHAGNMMVKGNDATVCLMYVLRPFTQHLDEVRNALGAEEFSSVCI
jgi:hypothetical protein